MRNRPDDFRAFRAIDDLASSSPKRMFALSPNDALVQVALPLVLILAIITRLMVIGQTIAAEERGPVILEMWKQQLILRLDQVMGNWEEESQLRAFPDFSRVQWEEAFPNDLRYQTLCRTGQRLNDFQAMKLDLYHQALQYTPSESSSDTGSLQRKLDLYDPLAVVQPENPGSIPPEFTITPERRAYALMHVEDRMLQWKQQIENLQWSTVAACASALPLSSGFGEADTAQQLVAITGQLQEKGYPLLRSITEEYERSP